MALDRIEGPGSYGAGGTGTNTPPERRDTSGVIYEPEPERYEKPKTLAQIREEVAREEALAARNNIHARFDGPGVTVELSTDGEEAVSKKSGTTIGSIFRDALRAIADFFSELWNGGSEKPQTVTETDASSDTVEEYASDSEPVAVAEAEEAEHAGNSVPKTAPAPTNRTRGNTPEEIAAFMVDYGGRRLAKNSDLLTQYDRRGHIVSMDPMVKKRILQGEGRIRRY